MLSPPPCKQGWQLYGVLNIECSPPPHPESVKNCLENLQVFFFNYSLVLLVTARPGQARSPAFVPEAGGASITLITLSHGSLEDF